MTRELPDPDRPLRIGTRGSPLALAQAHETLDRAREWQQDRIEITTASPE